MKLRTSFTKFPIIIILAAGSCFAQAKIAKSNTNAVSLSVTPTHGRVKQKITLTANVTTNNSPATGGTVVFSNGRLSLGSAQVVGKNPAKGYKTGAAVLTTILAPGSYGLIATYGGTASSPQIVVSNPVTYVVKGKTQSRTMLTAKANSQNSKNYDFTATVQVFGLPTPLRPVDFFDTTSGTDLGAMSVNPKSMIHGFAPAVLTQAGGMPAQSVVGDFNGDGYPDVVVTNAAFGPSTMAVFLGKANGEFQASVSYPTGYFCSGIVVGDYNNDGILDLVAMSQDGSIQFFAGNGDGSFQASLTNNIGGLPVSIAMGDFDRDGVLDYVTVDYFGNTASVSLGNGDGTFMPAVPYAIGSGPYSVATVDFNNDGFLDLAAVNDNDNTVSVLLGHGDGTFGTQKTYGTGNQVEFVVTGDLNRDGKQDIVVANYADQNVGVLIGNGDGTFKPQVTYSVSGPDAGLAITDLNGDGIPDIAASYYHPSQVGVLIGKGDGTFAAVHNYNSGQSQGYEITIADLNGDGTLDLINCDLNSSISVLLGGSAGRAILSDVAVPGTGAQQIVATYSGSPSYFGSKSKPVTVQGSGGK
jgi:hypothetical protein